MAITIIISREGTGEGLAGDLENALADLCAGVEHSEVLLLPHLYHLPEDSPLWARLQSIAGTVVVASWLHRRPAEWLLRRHQVGDEGLLTFHLGAYAAAEECFAQIMESLVEEGAALALAPALARRAGEQEQEQEQEQERGTAGPRWYPVVDLSRCINCRHCLQFCLFGVYSEDAAGQVCVANPDRCKPGCPACSRICPEGAIMFPLYAKDDAIAGGAGRLMAPDAAARRMFYTRTRKPCPVCGGTPGVPGATGERAEDGSCRECGRPAAAPAPEDRAVLDAIDSLIDDLDALARRRP